MHLEFGDKFNQILNKLPNNLKCLTFDKYGDFNQPFDNLSSKLKI